MRRWVGYDCVYESRASGRKGRRRKEPERACAGRYFSSSRFGREGFLRALGACACPSAAFVVGDEHGGFPLFDGVFTYARDVSVFANAVFLVAVGLWASFSRPPPGECGQRGGVRFVSARSRSASRCSGLGKRCASGHVVVRPCRGSRVGLALRGIAACRESAWSLERRLACGRQRPLRITTLGDSRCWRLRSFFRRLCPDRAEEFQFRRAIEGAVPLVEGNRL